MFIEALVIGLLVAYFRGGRLDNFTYFEVKAWYLAIIGLLLQLVPVFISGYGFLTYLQISGMILMLVVVAINYKVKGFWMMFLGGLMNLAAILVHDFRMPIRLLFQDGNVMSGFLDTVAAGDVINYAIVTEGTWTSFLGKILVTPSWYPFAKLLSAGDILVTVGLFLFIYGEMKRKPFRRNSTMVHYSYRSRI